MKETIYDVFWEGPFEWDNIEEHIEPTHVLYGLQGFHHLYGHDVLLYIGRTGAGLNNRLSNHDTWVEDEYDLMKVRIASIGEFIGWKQRNEIETYPKADPDIVHRIEAMLIYAHQPAYNTMNKESVKRARGIRIFNTGKSGPLLPEISFWYHDSQEK